MLPLGLVALVGAFLFAWSAYKGTSITDEILVAFGMRKGDAMPRPLSNDFPTEGSTGVAAQTAPTPGKGPCGALIGRPYQGSHEGIWQSANAIDIQAPKGTPIRAPFAGMIGLNFGWNTLGGFRLSISGREGEVYMAHLSGYAFGMGPGRRVKEGEIVGYVGDTGNAKGTTPHLHLAVRPPLNPLAFSGVVDCG